MWQTLVTYLARPWRLTPCVLLILGSWFAVSAFAQDPTATPPTVKPPATAPALPGDQLVNTEPTFLANVAVNHADAIYHEGDQLKVRFRVERESHVYLFFYQADGSALMLFPNKAHPNNQVKAQTEISIPGQEAEPFRFRVRPPFGQEVLQVLATTKPCAELDALDITSGKPPKITAELLSKVRDRLIADRPSYSEHRVRVETRPAESQPAARKPQRVGLFFGVNKYQDAKSSKPHEEFRRSVERFAKVMLERGQLDPKKTKVILNEESTRANFEEAMLKWLPSVSQPGDLVFIYYAGHGGQIPNLDGSEPDGLDEYITTYDNDIGTGFNSMEEVYAARRKRVILDDTFARWLQELPGRQIVLVLETCHGGGMVAVNGQDKSIFDHLPTRDRTGAPGRPGAARQFRFFEDETARVKDISQLNMVVITGCGPDESVWFAGGDDKMTLMALYMSEALEALPAPVTVSQAYEYMYVKIKTWLAAQKPPENPQEPNISRGVQEPTIIDTALLPIVLAPEKK